MVDEGDELVEEVEVGFALVGDLCEQEEQVLLVVVGWGGLFVLLLH